MSRVVFVPGIGNIPNPDRIPVVEQHLADALVNFAGPIVSIMAHEASAQRAGFGRDGLIISNILSRPQLPMNAFNSGPPGMDFIRSTSLN